MKLPEHPIRAANSSIDEMKEFILSTARKLNLDTGHSLPLRVLLNSTINFNPKQREALGSALKQLIDEGIFEEKNDEAILTEEGRDFLYGTANSSIDEMKEFILSTTRKLNLDTGHSLPLGVLLNSTINFNPKQREALEPALGQLIEEGIFEEKNGEAILTEKGRDILY